ncbi:UNVERIFIED_CONTAM: hypothetical protein Slati_0374300 [Sesamum latifolium]|uniref:Uncharacterized protein n=1 Tax=Sesamum latifolium TaxID=2727402 RepID=A0AAW2YGF7_9LAMI
MESHQILEINLITAQGLKTPSANLRRMQTYAVIWVNPGKKLRTRLDSLGGENLPGTTNSYSGTCLKRMIPIASAGGGSVGSSAFTAVQIRRPSGRFQGVLNIAAAVYASSEFPILGKVSAVSFNDLMDKKETQSRRQRRLSLGGSKWSQQSSERESCDLSDGGDSTTSSSSTASTALKEWNCVRELAGNKGFKADGGGLLCGLRKVPFCPSDQNLEFWGDSFEGNV